MAGHPRSALPPALHNGLVKLGGNLERSVDAGDLRAVLDGLGTLPADAVVKASREIANAAQLFGQPPMRRLRYRFVVLSGFPWVETALKEMPEIAWLLLFHSSGYVREAALEAIEQPPNSPFFFAAIAWRLNDWVEPVRLAAKQCAARVFPHLNPKVAAKASIYLLGRRLVWGRWGDEQKLLDLVFERADVAAQIAALMRESATGPLATFLGHAVRYATMDEHLPRLATEAVQPAVRALALRCLVEGKASWPIGFTWQWIHKVYGQRRRILAFAHRDIPAPPRGELIARGISDRSAIVRRVAADALIRDRSGNSNVQDIIARLAMDNSPSIRERAEYMMQNLN